MRFVGALEELLDPIVAVLDALPAHFDPDLAPRDILELLAAWLGVDLDESQDLAPPARDGAPRGRARPPARDGARASSSRSSCTSRSVPLRVEDNGGVRWSRDGRAPSETPSPSFVVYCDKPVAETTQAAIARCIEQYKPVHSDVPPAREGSEEEG